MKDVISQTRVSQLHPKWRSDAQSFIEDAENGLNITLRVTQGYRSFQVQEALYEQGRETPGPIVTNAKPGSSFHQYALAIDLVLLVNGQADWTFDMSKLLPYAAKYNIEWGGNWKSIKDRPHFQQTYGYKWQTLYAKYQAKDFIERTEFLNI
jgi:peptidoglycan LD-endopeptidase CwlK